MGYYKSPADMFEKRADKFKRAGDQHWAMAKNGEDSYHYGQAKACYNRANECKVKAEQARSTGATFRK